MSAPCYGKHALFDSTLLADHMEAVKLCAGCPLIATCRDRLEDSQAAKINRGGCPEGTWAGQLVVAGRIVTTDQMLRVATEEAAYSEEDARKAHSRFNSGHRDDWTEAGERTYQRRSERRQRARRRAAA